MERIYKYIEAHRQQWVDQVMQLVRQKSVSCTGEGVLECAELLRRVLHASGIRSRTIDGFGPPMVFGEIRSKNENAACVLIYGHYDVQPAGDSALWDSDPFLPEERDGRIYGRGVADDKGQFFTYIAAAQALKEVTGDVPVHLKFIFEGEEEVYSPHLKAAVEANKELLACDVMLNADVSYHNSGRPVINLGNKGMYMAELEIRTSDRDVHSMYGASVPSAAWEMVRVLSTIRDGNGKILIDGFYDDVKKPSEMEMKALATIPDAAAEYCRTNGVSALLDGDYRYNDAFEPTCNINSLKAGHIGAGTNSIVAGSAYARLDIRLVPDQTPERVHELLSAHLKKHGFTHVTLKWFGGMPLRVPVDHPFIGKISDALRDVWGLEPVIYPSIGAFSPFRVLVDTLEAPFIQVPIGNCDQNEHSNNENLVIDDFMRGIRTAAAILSYLA